MSEKLEAKTKLMFNFIGGTSIKIKSPLTREEIREIFNDPIWNEREFESYDEDRDVKSASIVVFRNQLQNFLILEMATVPVKLFNSDGIKS